MSYSELVKELKLENRLMAVTRVHAKDEKVNDIFGCVYKRFERVLNGETLVLKEGSCSCGGFAFLPLALSRYTFSTPNSHIRTS